MRAKVAWVQQVGEANGGFVTQSLNDSFNSRKDDLEDEFYDVDTTGGCYDYYSEQPQPRDPWQPPNGDDGGHDGGGLDDLPCEDLPPSLTLFSAVVNADNQLVLRGRMNHPPELCGRDALDYTQIEAQFSELISVNDTPQIETADLGFFKLTYESFEFTESYYQALAGESTRLPRLPVTLKLCPDSGSCLESNPAVIRVVYYGIESQYGVGEESFSVQSEGATLFSLEEVESLEDSAILPPYERNYYLESQDTGVLFGILHLASSSPGTLLGGYTDIEIRESDTQLKRVVHEKKLIYVLSGSHKNAQQTAPNSIFTNVRYQWDGKGKDGKRVRPGNYVMVVKDAVNVYAPTGNPGAPAIAKNPGLSSRFTFHVSYCPTGFDKGAYIAKYQGVVEKFRQYTREEMVRRAQGKSIGNPKQVEFPVVSKKRGVAVAKAPNDGTIPDEDYFKDMPLSIGGSVTGGESLLIGHSAILNYDKAEFSYPGTVKEVAEYGVDEERERLLAPPIDEETGEILDGKLKESERKIVEYLAHRYGTNYQVPSASKKHYTTKTFELYIDRPACAFCRGLPAQFRSMFPHATVYWVDRNGKCY